MKRLLLGLLLTGTLCAQTSIPAVVVDNSGQTAHGLQKSDFSVTCGKTATFDSVEEVNPVALNGFSDPTPVFILYDAVSVPAPTEGQVANTLLEYLRRAAAERLPVTLLVNQGGGVVKLIHDLSIDPVVLSAAISRIKSKESQPVPNNADPNFEQKVMQESERLRELTHFVPHHRFGPVEIEQLTALQAIGTMLQRSGKRKFLVWITAWFSMTVGSDEVSHDVGPFIGPYKAQAISSYQNAMDVLNKARVSVYPMGVPLPPATGETQYLVLSGIAMSTGGKVLPHFTDTNDFAASLADLRKHADSYYMIALSTLPQKTSWVSATIKVSRPDLKVAAPNGFLAGQ